MRTYHWITSILFGAIIVVTAAAAALRAVPYDAPENVDVVGGGLSHAFESHYDKVFPVKTFGTNLWGAIQYALFREGRAGVVVGQNGWLYTSEEFTDHENSQAQIRANLALIADVQQRLRQRGTELTVALVPAKVRLYPEYLAHQQPAALHRDLYQRVQQALQSRGVQAPDLLAALERCKSEQPVFLRTDTHWTPAGARCTAQALAGELHRARDDGTPSFVTEFAQAQPHQGDLMQFLPLAPYFSLLMPQPDLLSVATTQSLSADLLGDMPAPAVVLVGTSYSADERWNFDGALREVLDEDVLNMASKGRGPFEPMLAYLDQAPQDGEAPRRLIWEIPERYMPTGQTLDNGEPPAQIALGAAPPMHAAQP